MGRMNEWTGSKYTLDRDVADIAKDIRKDIKDAVASGDLPKGKYSVTIRTAARYRAININVKQVAISLLDPREPYPRVKSDYSAEGQAVLDKLTDIAKAYQQSSDSDNPWEDNSHWCNFWLSVGFDHELVRTRRADIPEVQADEARWEARKRERGN